MMKVSRWITLIVVVISISVFSICSLYKTRFVKCKQFSQGSFDRKTSAGIVVVNRFDDRQIEYGLWGDTALIYKVVWEDECTYGLYEFSKAKNTKNSMRAFSLEHPIEWKDKSEIALRVEMISLGKDYYVAETRLGGKGPAKIDTIWKRGDIGGFKAVGEIFSQ